MANSPVGKKAPDFSLRDQDGNLVQLSDFKGKKPVVLIFYPGDQTPGCTMQLCSARDDSSEYDKAGIAVFGVNPGSAESHQRFVNKRKLTMPLLVDTGLEVASRYDAVMGFGPLKIVNRTVVGIDQEGRIVFYERGIPSTRQILRAFSPVATPS
jgi:thioredoxin-dependent peroxiredoxin